jgi:hypothetical protein
MNTAINLAAVLTDIKNVDLSFFERRARASGSLEKLSLELGDNALSDAILLVSNELSQKISYTFDMIPKTMLYWMATETGKISEQDIRATVPAHLTLAGYIHTLISRNGAENQRAGSFLCLQASHTVKRKSSSYKDKYTTDSPFKVIRVMCNKYKLLAPEIDDRALMWRVKTSKHISRRKTSCTTPGCCNEFTYDPKGERAGKKRSRKGEQLFIPVGPTLAWIDIKDFRNDSKK